MSLNTNTLPTASDLSSEKRSVCLINDSFPPVIDGVANAVTNYASIIQRSFGDATVVTPYYPDADDSIYPFPVLRYPSIDVTKLVGYRAGLPLSPELMAQVEGRHIDLIHSHCPVTSTILARMLRQTSKPSIPGSIISRMATPTSGLAFRSSSASSPVPASTTS